jgi:hypothetical protein
MRNMERCRSMKREPTRLPRGVQASRELVTVAKDACPTISISPPPLVHVTSVGWGRRIIGAGTIEKRGCRVFGRELVYAFLGRPAYRFKAGDEKAEQLNFFPFAIVLSPDALPVPYHVYPFDTGAYVSGYYDEAMDPSIYLEDYELEPTAEAALRHVEWGFGSIDGYIDAKLKSGRAATLPDWRSVAKNWISIAGLASTGSNRPDRRASAVEFAYSHSIDLREGHGRLVVFPQQLLEDPRGVNSEFRDHLTALNIAFDTYEWRPNETPDSYANEIVDVVERNLRERSQT